MHNKMMELAIEQAKLAYNAGEVPVGAVVYNVNGDVISASHNLVETTKDATAHAEMVATKEACAKLGENKLTELFLAVTLEPCAMCAGAIATSRYKEVRFGAYDPKSGGVVNGARVFNHSHHKPEVYGGIMEEECAKLMTNFFKEKR